MDRLLKFTFSGIAISLIHILVEPTVSIVFNHTFNRDHFTNPLSRLMPDGEDVHAVLLRQVVIQRDVA
jgi:hypothetical protein